LRLTLKKRKWESIILSLGGNGGKELFETPPRVQNFFVVEQAEERKMLRGCA